MIGGAAVAGGALVAGCTATGQIDMVAIEQAIAKVQQGVASACKAAGTLIPTADSVWQIIVGLLGVAASSPVMVTAAAIEEAIKLITTAACAAVPAPQARRLGAPAAVSTKAGQVSVNFIVV